MVDSLLDSKIQTLSTTQNGQAQRLFIIHFEFRMRFGPYQSQNPVIVNINNARLVMVVYISLNCPLDVFK